MTTDAAHSAPAGLGRLATQVVLALGLGTALAVFVVLPAEYGVDPTGFGRLTGLVAISAPPEIVVETKLSAPPEVARVEPAAFREDNVALEIGAFGESLGALEYKISLEAGQTMVYTWRASKPVIFEFHGHTQPTDGSPVEVMNYMAGQGAESSGTLTAPIEGIHGWYFANPEFEPVTIELGLAGFYRLEPGIIGVH
jgi:hypothetical protein